MGLSIYYSGKLKSIDVLADLVSEVRHLCELLNWKCQVVQSSASHELRGVLFGPEGSEPVHLTFSPDGTLQSFLSVIVLGEGQQPVLSKEFAHIAITKTQYSGREGHRAIIKLLKYLKGKYFSVFLLQDEAGYWESDDERMLNKRFGAYENLVAKVELLLDDLEKIPGETPEAMAQRIKKILRQNLAESTGSIAH